MSAPSTLGRRTSGARSGQRGAALAIGLLLLPIATLLAVSAMATATLELRMAANAEYHQRAFEAAEFAIEEAIHSVDLGTGYTYSAPKLVPASGAPPAVPGFASDTYSYRLYYDATPADAATPPEAVSAGLQAYHFVIEASGASARGAKDVHIQGFYVLYPAGWSGSTTLSGSCETAPADCAAPGSQPERTFWRQQDAD
jgi:PilX N-terminal